MNLPKYMRVDLLQRTIFFLILPMSIFLSGCFSASARYQPFSLFSPPAPSIPSEWTLRKLPPSGSVHLEAVPVETATTAARMNINFFATGRATPIRISFNDENCTGYYEVTLAYAKSIKIVEFTRFEKRLEWGKPFFIDVRWTKSGNVEVALNQRETKHIVINPLPDKLVFELNRGGMDVKSLDYVNSY